MKKEAKQIMTEIKKAINDEVLNQPALSYLSNRYHILGFTYNIKL